MPPLSVTRWETSNLQPRELLVKETQWRLSGYTQIQRARCVARTESRDLKIRWPRWGKCSDEVLSAANCLASLALLFLSFSWFVLFFLHIIAELAERNPIIIQNSSNPSSRKNLVVRPYKVLLLTYVLNCTTALSGSPVVSALGSESDDLSSSPGPGKALCPWDVREKNASSAFRLG